MVKRPQALGVRACEGAYTSRQGIERKLDIVSIDTRGRVHHVKVVRHHQDPVVLGPKLARWHVHRLVGIAQPRDPLTATEIPQRPRLLRLHIELLERASIHDRWRQVAMDRVAVRVPNLNVAQLPENIRQRSTQLILIELQRAQDVHPTNLWRDRAREEVRRESEGVQPLEVANLGWDGTCGTRVRA